MTGLTGRRLRVLALMAEGRTNLEISELLGLAPMGANFHICRLLRELGAVCRAHAVGEGWRRGLLTGDQRDVDPGLTSHQVQIVALLADGLTYSQAARRLDRTTEAVKSDAVQARRKLGAANAAHAVDLAYRAGLLPAPVLERAS